MEEKNNGFSTFVKNMFKIGTPECALFCGVVALVIAVLLITIGFWKTLLVVAVVAAGMLVGGIANKGEKVRSLVDKVVPKKETTTYTAEDLRKYTQLRAQEEGAAEKPAEEETPEETAEETAPAAEEENINE